MRPARGVQGSGGLGRIDKIRLEPGIDSLVWQTDRGEIASVGKVGIEGRQNCTGSAGEESSVAESEITVGAGGRSVAAVARRTRGGGPW